jgi:molybdopterin-guanine dinucleotide biosynthesis protein B
MALVKPVIFQVVGYQNSGKTTFISQLIPLLKEEGLKVAAIKHHGHGGKPNIVENKDSSKHLASGAFVSLIEGNGRLILEAEKTEWRLEEKIRLLSSFDPDVILIEGYKMEQFPKLLFIRHKEDIELLKIVSNVIALVVWEESIMNHFPCEMNIPFFTINDPSSLSWIKGAIINQLSNDRS